ncbi:hypothetical protein ACEQ8H_003998 [Pleosporales sp. CAS-2024a]
MVGVDTDMIQDQEITSDKSETSPVGNKSSTSEPEALPNGSYPAYKALSYTWGHGIEESNIHINGKDLTITQSLANALFYLRSRSSQSLHIWIDQICINQKDLVEKTEQVQLMGRIYRNTEEALIWLGPAENGSDTLFDVFNEMGGFAERFDLYNYYTKERHHILQDIETRKNLADAKTIEYHTFCDDVLGSDEHGLPDQATFIIGNKRIKAETLMCVLQMVTLTIGINIIRDQPDNRPLIALMESWVDNISNTIQPFFSSRQRRKRWDEGLQEGDSLYTILQRICVEGVVQATQGCDMVYGLLGLVNDAERLRIRAEYSKDIGHERQAALTYTKTARALVESGKVDVLVSAQHVKLDMTLPSWVPDWRTGLRASFAEQHHHRQVDSVALGMQRKMEDDGTLPSWAPDWRQVLRRSFAWLHDEKADPIFSASNRQAVHVYEEGNDSILALDGYLVDEIEDVGGPWTGGCRVHDGESSSRFPHEEFLNLLAQVRQMCLVSKAKPHNNIYPTRERQDQAHWMVPCGGLDQDESFAPLAAGPSCRLKYEHCLAELTLLIEVYAMTLPEYKQRAAELVELGNTRLEQDHVSRNTGTMYRVRMQEMAGKRPFISHIGYVGMGPRYMRAGDRIAIFNGASVPFIVRPVDQGRFRLMGECYCDGIMFGEYIKQGGKMQKIVME